SDVRVRAWVAPLDEFSFPSGHTLHAVAFSTVAVAHYPVLAWALVPFTGAVALSRVVLGLHYPSDVLAATAIGGLLAAVSLWLVPGLPIAWSAAPAVASVLQQRLARQLPVAHRRVVREAGDDRRGLLQVVGRGVVVGVQVGVVDVAEVVQPVLH